MSLESAYLLGEKTGDIRETLRQKGWDKYPIIILKIDNTFKFIGIEQKSPGTVDVLPTRIEGQADPYLPSLVAKEKLRLNKKDTDEKKKENIQKFRQGILRKLEKLNRSAERMRNSQTNGIIEFGNAVSEIFKAETEKKKIAEAITKYAEGIATHNSEGINGLLLCVSVDGKHAENVPEVDAYLQNADQKESREHAGRKVAGQGRCAWCGKNSSLSSRMNYWKPGNVDNLFSAPYGRKEDTYKVIPICPGCHDRLRAGKAILDKFTSRPLGGNVRVIHAPRVLHGSIQRNLRDDLQEFWKLLREDILKFVQIGASQLSRRGEKVLSLRGASTNIDDLADMLEGECLTFDVIWLRAEKSSETILARGYDVVPTWLLRLAEITDLVNNKNRNPQWSAFAGLCERKFVLEGKHFWSLFPPHNKGKEAKKTKTKPLKVITLPWLVAAEVLEKRVRPFHEYLPDFFIGVDAYWCSAEEKERKRVFVKKGAEKTKIFEWMSLWHKFSFYVHLLRKETEIMEHVIMKNESGGSIDEVSSETNNLPLEEKYPRKVISAAVREADEAKVYKTRTEKGVFLAGIALGILAIYQDEDDKTMRVLDYPGDYRLGETEYKEFMLRFGEKLKDYLYVKDFKVNKGDIILGILSASTERTIGGFENFTPQIIGFALLSGVLRANHYYYMPGDKTKQKKGVKS